MRVANAMQPAERWINCYNIFDASVRRLGATNLITVFWAQNGKEVMETSPHTKAIGLISS